METNMKKQPSTKRFKPPLADQMPSGNASPLVRKSPLVRTAQMPSGNTSPLITTPQLRLVVSPQVVIHSPRSSPTSLPLAAERSPSLSPSSQPYLDEETSLPGN
jgi:hypothetical protein